MGDQGLQRDAITYSAVISAVSKGRQWGLAIELFTHMLQHGVECDAVTCCSLITAMVCAELLALRLTTHGHRLGCAPLACRCCCWWLLPDMP